MIRRSWGRVLGTICGVWLAVVLTGPAALHICPAHGETGGTHGHAGHAAAGLVDPGSGAHSGHGDGEKAPASACVCLGDCAGASAVGVPGAGARVPAPAWIAIESPPAVDFAFAPAPADHLLPFANGPPSLS